ncbi:Crp/Fnr family transcriptional regulator [Mucilaginibacter gynuensis]|uniref:Crp/Fnr family transcriptional regulator n=1 Tax=Mucilaginibacter gynuensis TaxID=1302236 RepID=A0ABP8GV36_9SPHI
MDNAQLVQFLHNSQLVSLTGAQKIATHFKEKAIAKNEYFLESGHICSHYLFLASGFLRAFAHDVEGNEVTTGFYSPNQMVFEVSSYFNRVTSKENIQALVDSKGWFITYEELNTLFHAMPEFREFGRSVLVKGFTALKTRTLSMITETAEERYANLLKTNPEIIRNAPLKTIASYLGITDTSLSRIRKEIGKKS